jgi:hypothetical protein
MLIKYNETRQRFEAETSYAERGTANPLLKAAGFAFDFNGAKVWHTAGYKAPKPMAEQAAIAAKLFEYLDGAAKSHIANNPDLNVAVIDSLAAQVAKADALEASRATDCNIDIPCPEGLAYLPFQKAGIAYARLRPSVLIADEMGLGKTIQGIGISNDDPKVQRVLIECPASLKLNWAREWVKWDIKGLTVGVVVTQKLKAKAMARLEKWAQGRVQISVGQLPETDVVIVNYDILDRYLPEVHAHGWDLILVDEAHKLKNPKAKRTKAMLGERVWDKEQKVWNVISLPVAATRRAFLTGTPIVNRPAELWPFCLALDPDGLGKYKSKYEKRYCGAGFDANGYYTKAGATNLDELQTTLREKFMVRRLKVDVLKDLPAKRRQVIVLESDGLEDLLAKEATEYDKLGPLEEGGEGFTELAAARKAVGLAKVPFAIEHLKAVLENTDKVVVMAHHYEVVDALKAALVEYGVVGVDGRVTDITKRDAAVQEFQNNPNIRVFVGTIQAAGVGLTLTAASTVVFAELDWVPGNMTQAEDRCHRIGQLDAVLVQHLVFDGSVDANLVEKIITKQAVIDAALDNKVVEAPKPVVGPAAAPATRNPNAKLKDEVVLTPEQVAAVHAGLRRLAAVCDGAYVEDGHGFNKMDSQFGKSLAGAFNLTQKQALYGQKLVRKYQRQLDPVLVANAGITPMEAK